MGQRIFTIAHGLTSFTAVSELCKRHRITTIIDVRSKRLAGLFSRHSSFHPRRFQRFGLRYEHGGSALSEIAKKIRTDEADGLICAYFDEIEELVERSRRERIALLCTSLDWDVNFPILNDLTASGVEVVNLSWRLNGSIDRVVRRPVQQRAKLAVAS